MGWSYRGLGPFSPKSMESIDCVVFHQQLPDCDENSGSTWATNICQKSLWWFLDKGNVWTRDASSLRKEEMVPYFVFTTWEGTINPLKKAINCQCVCKAKYNFNKNQHPNKACIIMKSYA